MITFKCEMDDKNLVMETHEITWPAILEDFRNFLKGCGYFMPEGEIHIDDMECPKCKERQEEFDDIVMSAQIDLDDSFENQIIGNPTEEFEIEVEKPTVIVEPGEYRTKDGHLVYIIKSKLTPSYGEFFGYGTSVQGWWDKHGNFCHPGEDFTIVGKFEDKNLTDLE